MHKIQVEIKNEKALNLLAKQNEHEANKTLFTIQEILNDTDWDRVKSKNVLKKFESVWDQLEDVRLGYAYKRRLPGPIKAIKSYNNVLHQEKV